MGGPDNVLKLGRASYDKGDYRWTAEIVNYVVYADPGNQAARELQADALEQMGFQAESATWRGYYLSGAQELRTGQRMPSASIVDPRTIPVPLAVDYASTLVNPEKANGMTKHIGLSVTDEKQAYTLTLENSVLLLGRAKPGEPLDASIVLTAPEFGAVIGGQASAAELVSSGKAKASGDPAALDSIVSLLDRPSPSFPLVTPVDSK